MRRLSARWKGCWKNMDSRVLVLAFGYLALMNLAGFLSMLIDKRKARQKKWRIPENTLLLIALLGGSVGSILGMQIFRHKTKHAKFKFGLPLILIAQLAAAYLLVFC